MSNRLHSIRRSAFTLVEAVVCTAVVGLLLVAALSTSAAARTTEYRMANRERGMLLARQLLAEMLTQPYSDPEEGTAGFGAESGESDGTRRQFDDFDDYRNWSASPPQTRDGEVLTDLTGWKRQVQVRRLNPSNLNTALSESGLKSCTISVWRDGALVAELSAIRAEIWQMEAR